MQNVSKIVDALLSRKAMSIFEELGASVPDEVRLDKVAPDRLSLDRKVLEAIGISDHAERDTILLELYKSVIDLVKCRLEKAKSVVSKTQKSKKPDIAFYVNELLETMDCKHMQKNETISFMVHIKAMASRITPDRRLQDKIVDGCRQKIFGDKVEMF